MKHQVQNYFRKLSLTQQVISIILLMVVFLLLFFMFFLSDSINHTISRQIYDMLQARQEPIVNALDLGKQPSRDMELFGYISTDANMSTMIVNDHHSEYVSRPVKEDSQPVDEEFGEELDRQAKAMLESDETVHETTETFHGKMYYCRFERASYRDHPSIVVSYMDDTYAQEIRTSLMDSTVYVTVLVFLLLLLIFLLWVFSIIRPLNQIKAYIAQIKEGKDVDLYINREDEIGDVAQELRTLTAELSKQEKAKEEMIHNISHDLKTPIATIKSYSESIKDGIYPYGDLESSVDVILDNAKRLEDKVHSLLYMNRVEYLVSSDAEGVTTNMKDVVEEVVLNAKVIRPEIELITDVEEVYFDGLFESWRVCVENILQNAFRYAKSYIKIEVRDNELIISNDGPKMPEDRIESLFKPYIKGEGGRFGLGLSIVSKVVQANRYKVQGFNTQDGAAFRIWRDVPNKNSGNRFKTGGMNLNVPHWTTTRKAAPKPEAKDKDVVDVEVLSESRGPALKAGQEEAKDAPAKNTRLSRTSRHHRSHTRSQAKKEAEGSKTTDPDQTKPDPEKQADQKKQPDSVPEGRHSRKTEPKKAVRSENHQTGRRGGSKNESVQNKKQDEPKPDQNPAGTSRTAMANFGQSDQDGIPDQRPETVAMTKLMQAEKRRARAQEARAKAAQAKETAGQSQPAARPGTNDAATQKAGHHEAGHHETENEDKKAAPDQKQRKGNV